MKIKIIVALLVIACIFSLMLPISAHSGDTDSNGGHYDHSSGEYHYHHGYPAHQHYDINGDGVKDCPYLYKGGNSSETNTPTFPELPDCSFDFDEILNVILIMITLSIIVPIFLYWMYSLASFIVLFMFPKFDQDTTKSKIILMLLAIVLMAVLLTVVGLTN